MGYPQDPLINGGTNTPPVVVPGICCVGAALLFTKTSGGWNQTEYFKARHPDIDDAFGHSVAISTNTTPNLVIVGSPGDDSRSTDQLDGSAPDEGAVFVFRQP